MTHHLPRFLAEEIDDDVLGEIADNDAMLKGLGLKIGEIIRFRRYVEKHDAPRLLVNRVSASSSVDDLGLDLSPATSPAARKKGAAWAKPPPSPPPRKVVTIGGREFQFKKKPGVADLLTIADALAREPPRAPPPRVEQEPPVEREPVRVEPPPVDPPRHRREPSCDVLDQLATVLETLQVPEEQEPSAAAGVVGAQELDPVWAAATPAAAPADAKGWGWAASARAEAETAAAARAEADAAARLRADAAAKARDEAAGRRGAAVDAEARRVRAWQRRREEAEAERGGAPKRMSEERRIKIFVSQHAPAPCWPRPPIGAEPCRAWVYAGGCPMGAACAFAHDPIARGAGLCDAAADERAGRRSRRPKTSRTPLTTPPVMALPFPPLLPPPPPPPFGFPPPPPPPLAGFPLTPPPPLAAFPLTPPVSPVRFPPPLAPPCVPYATRYAALANGTSARGRASPGSGTA